MPLLLPEGARVAGGKMWRGRGRDSVRQAASIARVTQLLDWPDLDHPDAQRWEPRGDRTGLVHVLGLDDEESAYLLLRLRERAVGGGDLAGVDADGACRRGPLQSVRNDEVAAPSDLLRVLDRGVDESLHLLLGHRVQHLLVVVDDEHELHGNLLRSSRPNIPANTSHCLPRRRRMAADTSLSSRGAEFDSRGGRAGTGSWGEPCPLERHEAPIRVGAQL